MYLIGVLSLLLLVTGARSVWSQADADRRFIHEKPKAIKYDPSNVDKFLSDHLKVKLQNMPLPDDPDHIFVPDVETNLMTVCKVPEDDGDSMEVSGRPNDIMETVIRSFADGKCAGRAFGEWYYQVCGNMAVKRSPYTVGSGAGGKRKVDTFRAYESLGVMGRFRRVSSHLVSAMEPRFVEQTYFGGVPCVLEGDERRVESTVTFECSRRFVPGYVHIFEVQEENPCRFTLRLQSHDFCENAWLRGDEVHESSVIPCRIYFHPERVQPLVTFLDKFATEMEEQRLRFNRWYEDPEQAEFAKKLEEAKSWTERARVELEIEESFDAYDNQWGRKAELERKKKMVDYVFRELAFAFLDPTKPFSEKEKEIRKREEEQGLEEDKRVLARIKGMLDAARRKYMREAEDEESSENFEYMTYWELFSDYVDIFEKIDYLDFYTSWLDHLQSLENEEGLVVRHMLLPPHRSFIPGTYVVVESVVETPYTESEKDIFKARHQQKQEMTLYDGEQVSAEEEMEEISRAFMQLYKWSKSNAGANQDLLFDLLDDQDFQLD